MGQCCLLSVFALGGGVSCWWLVGGSKWRRGCSAGDVRLLWDIQQQQQQQRIDCAEGLMALSDPYAHTEGCSSFQSTLLCVRAPSVSQMALHDSRAGGRSDAEQNACAAVTVGMLVMEGTDPSAPPSVLGFPSPDNLEANCSGSLQGRISLTRPSPPLTETFDAAGS